MSTPTYTIGPNGSSITCNLCGRTSHNLNDVKNRYCGACHVFHDDPASVLHHRAQLHQVMVQKPSEHHQPMNWIKTPHWDAEDALQRERATGHANPPPSEAEHIYQLQAPALIGRKYRIENGVVIQACFHYNGSQDGSSFGGARKWPAVRLTVDFQEGDIAKRDAFIEKLKTWLEANLDPIDHQPI